MDNYAFTHYYGRHKKRVVQPNVVQFKKEQFRMSGDLLKKFDQHLYYEQDDNRSKFIKTLIKEALEKRESESWEKELQEDFE